MDRVGLIDGDIYAYRYAWANQETYDWGDTGVSEVVDFDAAKRDIEADLHVLCDALKLDRVVICLSSASNFRKHINPQYKANRKKTSKPSLLRDIRLWLIAEFETRIVRDLEADDVLGILQTGNRVNGKKIIVSTDKDMLTVPGWVYNPRTEMKRNITPQEADYWLYRQILTGDTVDNYKGVPGIGPKKAEKILGTAQWSTPKELWELVTATYRDAGLGEEEALLNARMAYILRAENYDFEKEEVKLWEPPK